MNFFKYITEWKLKIMGILRLLLFAIVFLLIALAILPKTKKEQVLERKVLKGIIFFCSILILTFSVSLFFFKDTLWQSDPYNHPLIQKIINDRFIKQININSLDMQGVDNKALSDALSKNNSLETLGIRDISPSKIDTIIEALSNNKYLLTLEIKNLSTKTCEKIANSFTKFNIKQLQVNSLSTQNLNIILEGLIRYKNITTLTLKNAKLDTYSANLLNQVIKTNSELTSLDLSFNTVKDDELKIFSDSLNNGNKLSVLNLFGNELTDDGLKFLVEALKNNSTVTKLLLGYNKISDVGIKYISTLITTNQTIKIIDLTRTEINDISAYELSEAVSKNNSLEKIILSSTLFTKDIKKLLRELQQKNEKRIFIENYL